MSDDPTDFELAWNRLHERVVAIAGEGASDIRDDQIPLTFSGLDVDAGELEHMAKAYAAACMPKVLAAAINGTDGGAARMVRGAIAGALSHGVALGLLMAQLRAERERAE